MISMASAFLFFDLSDTYFTRFEFKIYSPCQFKKIVPRVSITSLFPRVRERLTRELPGQEINLAAQRSKICI